MKCLFPVLCLYFTDEETGVQRSCAIWLRCQSRSEPGQEQNPTPEGCSPGRSLRPEEACHNSRALCGALSPRTGTLPFPPVCLGSFIERLQRLLEVATGGDGGHGLCPLDHMLVRAVHSGLSGQAPAQRPPSACQAVLLSTQGLQGPAVTQHQRPHLLSQGHDAALAQAQQCGDCRFTLHLLTTRKKRLS